MAEAARVQHRPLSCGVSAWTGRWGLPQRWLLLSLNPDPREGRRGRRRCRRVAAAPLGHSRELHTDHVFVCWVLVLGTDFVLGLRVSGDAGVKSRL